MAIQRRWGKRIVVAMVVLAVVAATTAVLWLARSSAPGAGAPPDGTVVHSVRSGAIDVVVLSPMGTFRSGRNAFSIEFRNSSGALVDVGSVRVSANMTMPGMVMPGNAQVQPTGVAGRYTVTAEFGMAGAWPITIDWDGPAGRGAVTFEGSVQ